MKKSKSIAMLAIVAMMSALTISCKKNPNEADGTYYNERTGETGSNDTAAVTNRTKVEVEMDSTGVVSPE